MKEPIPFQPYWVAFRGGVREEGRGLLPGAKDTVSKFIVHCGDFQISILPKEGELWLDSRLVVKKGPGELVWLRTMQFKLGTVDDNHFRPHCLNYLVGFKNGDELTGYKLFEDGRIAAEGVCY